MIDRLAQIRQLATKRGLNLDVQDDQSLEDDKELRDFTVKIQLVQKYNNQILAKVERMEEIREEISIAVGAKEKDLSTEIDNLIDLAMDDQKKSKYILDDLNNKVTAKKKEDPENRNSETRILNNLYGAFVKQFGECMNKFQSVQSDIKSKIQNKVLRDAEIVLNRKLDPSEQEKILQDQSFVQKALAEKLSSSGHIKLQNAVSDIEERYRDIVKLENSVNAVHKLFIEMAALVQLQGEIIDNIETNVKSAKNHVQKAEVDIKKSKENLISARKKKCCILIIVLVILLGIVLPILGVKFF